MSNQTEEVNTRLDLVACLFVAYLEKAGLLNESSTIKYNERTRKHVEITAPADQAASVPVFGSNVSSFEIIFMDMGNGEKCMISLCSQEESLKQRIFNYRSDLFLDESKLEFPMQKHDAIQNFAAHVLPKLQSKFRLIQDSDLNGPSKDELEGEPRRLNSVQKEIEKLKFGAPPRQHTSDVRGRPSDMPEFEDEYEAQSFPGIPVTGEFGVPGLAAFPPQNTGYGDADLYPTGEKLPNLQDPRVPLTQRGEQKGGMIFDPFRGGGPSSNPLQRDPTHSKGPKPPFPGARFDDPFGRMSHQGGGPGFI
ncbi:LAFE_0C01156g1_1 [Lachancea fermentati]|uniref:LAFE_0C01156g1_1 n=1 Tax=Lachancea fermentati TaxID=4955 RepID=A0A1G4M8W2_LACFM|nr:LAFE_0C01156g1_1 [Lachancea fermentati]